MQQIQPEGRREFSDLTEASPPPEAARRHEAMAALLRPRGAGAGSADAAGRYLDRTSTTRAGRPGATATDALVGRKPSAAASIS
jgi:hypothetical protein